MRHILTLNAGSSSIKFALFEENGALAETIRGQVEGLGAAPRLESVTPGGEPVNRVLDDSAVHDHDTALGAVLAHLETAIGKTAIEAVGHRIVHGGIEITAPVVLDAAKLAYLDGLVPLAPLHQPHNLSGVRAAARAFPNAVQVGCFDTSFHRAHPFVNDTYALPHEFYDKGIRRYGFHGLSYEYVTGRLREIAPAYAAGRVIVAHLGNGASMCAIRDGLSVGSTMGFTALDGLPMGTRCGQLDPGVVLYMLDELKMDVREVEQLLYTRSGLKGLSGLSQDMRELEAAGTVEAQHAIDYFVFRARREVGAMAAILGGVDAVVFAGGIGEHAFRVRGRICEGFEWLGLEVDEDRNRRNDTVFSTDRSRVRAFVVPTNEELMIARHTAELAAG